MKALFNKHSPYNISDKFPSRFIEKSQKLFYWHDPNYPATEEMIDILKKYNVLQDNEGGLITVPSFEIDESKKIAFYYFCSKDSTEYKRVISNKAKDYFNPPKLKCNY